MKQLLCNKTALDHVQQIFSVKPDNEKYTIGYINAQAEHIRQLYVDRVEGIFVTPEYMFYGRKMFVFITDIVCDE